jgi:hypothetical protein
MRIAIGVRAAGVWIALAAIALLAACNGDGTGGLSATAKMGAVTRVPVSSHASTPPSATPPTPHGVTNATISWVPPTQDTSGSAVGALGGYKIYYGTASQQYTTTINVSNPGLTTYVIDALEIGVTYYFAVTAVSASGIESTFSPEVAATIS